MELQPGKKLNYSLHWFALVLGFGASQKSRNALFGEVPKRRRQLGGTKKLGFSKKHLLGEVPKRRRQLGGTEKLGYKDRDLDTGTPRDLDTGTQKLTKK